MAHRTVAAVTMLLMVSIAATLADDYDVGWHTVDGGGEMLSTGGQFELSGTIGQPDARNHPQPMTGEGYTLTGGFWVIPECPAIPADFDADCDVDQADYRVLESCASGPMIPYTGDCDDADFDSDNDVDQSDFAVLQRCMSGADLPADPDCAD